MRTYRGVEQWMLVIRKTIYKPSLPELNSRDLTPHLEYPHIAHPSSGTSPTVAQSPPGLPETALPLQPTDFPMYALRFCSAQVTTRESRDENVRLTKIRQAG